MQCTCIVIIWYYNGLGLWRYYKYIFLTLYWYCIFNCFEWEPGLGTEAKSSMYTKKTEALHWLTSLEWLELALLLLKSGRVSLQVFLCIKVLRLVIVSLQCQLTYLINIINVRIKTKTEDTLVKTKISWAVDTEEVETTMVSLVHVLPWNKICRLRLNTKMPVYKKHMQNYNWHYRKCVATRKSCHSNQTRTTKYNCVKQ